MLLEPGHFAWLPEGAFTLHGLLSALGLLVFAIGSQTLQQRRHPAVAIAWVLLILLIPEAGLPLYLLFGTRKLTKATGRPGGLPGERDVHPPQWAQRLTDSLGLAPAAAARGLRIHEDGTAALEALHRVIASARHRLDLSTFVIGRDAFGDELLDLLAQRAADGVRVRLLVDGVGGLMGGRRDFRRARAAGVEVQLFVPLWRLPLRGRTNLRNHRKLVVADGRHLWSGGRNLAGEYFLGRPGHAPWDDLSFDLQGPLARRAAELFEEDWVFAGGAAAGALPEPPASTPVRGDDPGSRAAQLVPTGPDWPFDTVHAMLLTVFFRARTRILVVTPYFVPDESLLAAMSLAARRGVQVDLLLPRRSNHRLADLARGSPLRELLAAGVQVRFSERMIHAKAIVVDSGFALCGSVNLDSRSLFLNYELMTAFYEAGDANAFEVWVETRWGAAVPAAQGTRAPRLARRLLEGLVAWLAFQL